jgi:hypothetical protein
LHIEDGYQCEVAEGDVDPYDRALEALLQSNPEIVINDEAPSFESHFVWGGSRFEGQAGPADRRPPGTGFF